MKQPLTKKQFKAKKKELNGIVARLELMTFPQDKKDSIDFIFDKLAKDMDALESDFLELKLAEHKQVYDLIRQMTLTPAQAEKLKSLPEWKALEAHMKECVALFDTCSLIPDSDDHDKAARGRKEAVRIITKILEPFQLNVAEPMDVRKDALRKARSLATCA